MVAYAPNVGLPLDVVWEMQGRGQRLEADWFRHSAVTQRQPGVAPATLAPLLA